MRSAASYAAWLTGWVSASADLATTCPAGKITALSAFTVLTVIDVPERQHQRAERGRVAFKGRSTDDGSQCTLLVVNEDDGSWTFHGLGAPGVTLSKADTISLAQSMLGRAR